MLRLELDHPTLSIGVVRAAPVSNGASPAALIERIRAHESALRSGTSTFAESTRAAVRDVLRFGGYKPTGRGKPASEYLLGVATGDGMPAISLLVDLNNDVSLRTGFPISIFDADLLGSDVSIRFGRPGESYVFNQAGHAMDLEGLPVVCRGDEPVGNAVKDSMACKVNPGTTAVVAVVYGTTRAVEGTVSAAARLFAELLGELAGATAVSVETLP